MTIADDLKGVGGALSPPDALPQGEGDDVPPAPAQSPDVIGFVGLFIDHMDSSVFASDIYATRGEARGWSAALPKDKFFAIAAIVILESADANQLGT